MNQLCKVCGEPAAGFHFGAFTCEGCKSFFGRTYNNISSISECKNNGECVINKKNRTACKACRLRKCLLVGMSKSGSRYGRRSNWFKIHCLLQEQQQQAQQHVQQHAHAHAAGAAAAANMAAAAAAAANLLRPHPYLSPLFRSSPLTSSTTMGSTRETRSSESDSGASSADPDDDARSSSALGYPLKPTGSPISDRDYFSGASLKKLPSPASDSECFDRRKFISALVNAPSVSPASLPSISPSGLTPSRWMMPSLQGMAADTALWRDLWSKSLLPPCSTANNMVNNSQVDHQQLEPIDLSVKSHLVTGVPPPHPSSDSDSSCNSDPELCIDVGIDEPVKSVPLDLTLDRPATDVVSN